jgi:DNA-binding MarR family transcriptional regulator
MNSSLDEQLQQHLAQRQHSLIRMLGLLKKDMDCRIVGKLTQRGYDNFKLGDLVLIVNIDREGTINNELAKKARITKQAMSKVVKNLEAGGYIRTRKHASDNRAAVIFLTDNGKQLIVQAAESFQEIEREYQEIVGPEDTDALKQILTKLVGRLLPGVC